MVFRLDGLLDCIAMSSKADHFSFIVSIVKKSPKKGCQKLMFLRFIQNLIKFYYISGAKNEMWKLL